MRGYLVNVKTRWRETHKRWLTEKELKSSKQTLSTTFLTGELSTKLHVTSDGIIRPCNNIQSLCPKKIKKITTRFTEYQADIVKKKKEQFGKIAVFPCKLKMLPDHIYTRRDPIVAGVKVEVSRCLFIFIDLLRKKI